MILAPGGLHAHYAPTHPDREHVYRRVIAFNSDGNALVLPDEGDALTEAQIAVRPDVATFVGIHDEKGFPY